jgi:nucleotide-binding universal stress UspA family protein
VAVRAPQPLRPAVAYRRLLVPLSAEAEAESTLALACRLAAEHRAQIVAVTVIEVPAELPLDSHMLNEEARARELLELAHAIAGRYGVAFSGRTLRAREAGRVIVDEAERADVDVVLLSVPRKPRFGSRPRLFGRTAGYVLRNASCRVLLLAPPAR